MRTKKFSQRSSSTNVVSVMCTKQRPWSDFKLEASVRQTQGNEISKKHSRTPVHLCWGYKMWFVTFVASSAQNKLYFKWHLELGGGEGQFLCRQLAAQLCQSPPPPLRPGSSPRDFATCQTSPIHTPVPAPFSDFWPSLPSNKIVINLPLRPVLIHLRPEVTIPFSWIWILLVPIEQPKEKWQQKPSAHLRWKQFPPAKSTAEC